MFKTGWRKAQENIWQSGIQLDLGYAHIPLQIMNITAEDAYVHGLFTHHSENMYLAKVQ